jgi:hypothetical protein
MDASTIISVAIQFSLVIAVFTTLLIQSIWWGRQSLVNLIVGLLLAVLMYKYFPYFDTVPETLTTSSKIFLNLGIFGVISIATILFTKRVMPTAYQEGHFESFAKKILLAVAGTCLIAVIGFTIFAAQEILISTSPQLLTAIKESFVFWWLLAIGVIVWYAS